MAPTSRPPDLDVVGFGAINVDYIVTGPTSVGYFDDLETGEEHHEKDYQLLQQSIDNLRLSGHPFRVQLGGSALNTMRALAGLAPDLRVGFVSTAGGVPADLPPEADLSELTAALDLMIDWTGGPLGTCVSVLTGGERTLTTYNNTATAGALSSKKYRDKVLQRLLRGRIVHVTSIFGAQGAKQTASLLGELRERRKNVIISVDLGHVWAADDDARSVLKFANYVFFNEAELSLVPPMPPSAELEAQEQYRAEWILNNLSRDASRLMVLKKKHQAGRGPDYVGRTGAVLFHRKDARGPVERYEIVREALAPAQIVDSTGAGDVFAAGVLAAVHSPQVEAHAALSLGFSAARHKMLRPGIEGYEHLDTVVRKRALRPGRGKVFVSHARPDRELVSTIENLLAAGSPYPREEQFFCSSLALQGPRPAQHVRRTIWETLRAAEYAVFVVTPSFLESRECAYELGAAAVLGIPSIPIVAPGIRFRDLSLPVGEGMGGRLDRREDLAAVHGELTRSFGYETVNNQVFDGLISDVVREVARIADPTEAWLYGSTPSPKKTRRTSSPQSAGRRSPSNPK
jgi:sugar/nucleoside kinase (ribokinase family)